MTRKAGLGGRLAAATALLIVVAACSGGGQATVTGQPPVATSGLAGAGPGSPTSAPPPALPSTAAPGARIVSPAPGSTLPADAVTFTWDNTNGDYFLAIESVAGAHDIFFAIVHVTSITLGPACAQTSPIQCIPPHGEKIFVKLMTQTKGVWNTGFDYTYTAAGG